MKKYFCTAKDYAVKTDLSMGYWKPESKLGEVGHFLEIIKQQLLLFKKKDSKMQSNLWRVFSFSFFFFKLKLYFLLKKHGYP